MKKEKSKKAVAKKPAPKKQTKPAPQKAPAKKVPLANRPLPKAAKPANKAKPVKPANVVPKNKRVATVGGEEWALVPASAMVKPPAPKTAKPAPTTAKPPVKAPEAVKPVVAAPTPEKPVTMAPAAPVATSAKPPVQNKLIPLPPVEHRNGECRPRPTWANGKPKRAARVFEICDEIAAAKKAEAEQKTKETGKEVKPLPPERYEVFKKCSDEGIPPWQFNNIFYQWRRFHGITGRMRLDKTQAITRGRVAPPKPKIQMRKVPGLRPGGLAVVPPVLAAKPPVKPLVAPAKPPVKTAVVPFAVPATVPAPAVSPGKPAVATAK